ncbi:hypothetical protein N8693_02550 [Verrucomicrobia bacterium]|nr:hypothetical protein [Verrucomicrobiota bacterium]
MKPKRGKTKLHLAPAVFQSNLVTARMLRGEEWVQAELNPPLIGWISFIT